MIRSIVFQWRINCFDDNDITNTSVLVISLSSKHTYDDNDNTNTSDNNNIKGASFKWWQQGKDEGW